MIALSSSYFTLRQPEPSAEAIVREARGLGFRAIEVDYRVTAGQLRRLQALVDKDELKVVSVHHPLPRPAHVSPFEAHEDRPSLASLDREERRAAIRAAAETLARAAELAARAAVFHVGWVELDPGVDPRELERLVRREGPGSKRQEEVRATISAARQARARPHLEALLSSLDRVAGEAVKRGVLIGVENRYHPEQIPNQEELERIFQALDGAPIGYWHDTGHAESLFALGMLGSRTEVLAAFRDRIIGFHLHDATGLDDHKAPGEGEIDFSALAPYVTSRACVVLEIHPPSPPEAVARAPAVLAEAGPQFRAAAS